MNKFEKSTEDANWDDAQWCQLYLLGELTPDQADRFEHRLGSSGVLSDELLMQSDLLLAIAPEGAPVVPRMPARLSQGRLWAVAAIAASLVCVVTAGWHRQQRTSEELLIARAWAETFAADPVEHVEAFVAIDESATDTEDADFDWMFVAVAIDDSISQPHRPAKQDHSDEG